MCMLRVSVKVCVFIAIEKFWHKCFGFLFAFDALFADVVFVAIDTPVSYAPIVLCVIVTVVVV